MMKNNILEYKGYHTQVEFDAEDNILHGKIEGITDLVTFECSSIADVAKEFHDAVDDYIAFCEEVGKDPEKSYKGSFNVRISPELHKKVAIEAQKSGESLNATVEKALRAYVSNDRPFEPIVLSPDSFRSATQFYQSPAYSIQQNFLAKEMPN